MSCCGCNSKLEKLVEQGTLKSFRLVNLNEDRTEVAKVSGMRNTERLVLVFPNDSILTIDTFCSGCAENTTLIIS